MRRANSALCLAAGLTVTGSTHFALPRPFDEIVPRGIPGSPRTWTYLSGAAELACAAALAAPRTRRTGAAATALLLVAVFPANIKMALDHRARNLRSRYAAYARLPMQLPLIGWALRVRRDTGR
ncbi:putative membrane protein [Actinopolyspora biskrensis]|uniref:Putative membrane protein n=1 Tax=Actinopolyspora biskrensis TaxID=1470178 RepID=A0A852YZM3_9ACTN|nr:DoxX family protein [Actinopolyspora biskrensis]NYH80041.1 putative membrane protein [Actinopolyspora biskrensis]